MEFWISSVKKARVLIFNSFAATLHFVSKCVLDIFRELVCIR